MQALVAVFSSLALGISASAAALGDADPEADGEPPPLISSRDLTAILGGVVCFWGGVWALGAVFMVVLMAKNYCIKSAAAGTDID